MINSVTLKNFQRHKDSTFELAPITVIEGVSDQGKSSFVRALYWLTFNRPVGADCFRKYGTKQVEVKVDIDGTIITRSRTEAGEHTYTLDDETFQGFGKEVPLPVSDFLKLQSLHFCGQHDGAFLLAQPRPEASRYLASLVGLEQMDKAMQTVEHKRRSIASDVNSKQEEIEALKSELKRTKFVKKMSVECDALVELSDIIGQLEDEVDDLESILQGFDELEQDIKKLKDVNSAYNELVSLETIRNETAQSENYIDGLESLINEIDEIDAGLCDGKMLCECLDWLETNELLRRGVVGLSKEIDALEVIVDSIEEIDEQQENIVLELRKSEKLFKDEMPEICPLCGSDVE